MSKDKAYLLAQEWLERVGILARKDYFPGQLSGEQQQHVAIAMNLKLMLFDEVTSVLDPERVHEVLEVILDLAKDGMAMLLVTHEMQFAHDVSNRVIFMQDGRIGEESSPKELFKNPKSECLAAFLKSLKF